MHFLSDEFNTFYNRLIYKYQKNKVLSIKIFDYIRNNYTSLFFEESLKKEDKLYLKNYFTKKKNKKDNKKILESENDNLNLSFLLNQVRNDGQIKEIKYKAKKLKNEIKLNKNLDINCNEQGEFNFINKIIISKNIRKLNKIKPNEKIINLSLNYIYYLKHQIMEMNPYFFLIRKIMKIF